MQSNVSTTLLAGAHARAVGSRPDTAYQRHPGRLRRISVVRVVGRGPACFADAASALCTLRVHSAAGIEIHPGDAEVTDGLVVVLGLGYGRAAVLAPCLVTQHWSGPASAGFTYVTLAGHPVSGWEEFTVSIDRNDVVTFGIVAESVPAWTMLRRIAPVQNLLQDRIIGAYLSAMTGIVAGR